MLADLAALHAPLFKVENECVDDTRARLVTARRVIARNIDGVVLS